MIGVVAAVLLVGAGLPRGVPTATADPVIQGQVVSEIDPFLLLRNLIRIDPESFQTLWEQLLTQYIEPAIESSALPDAVKPILVTLIEAVPTDDPEGLIDFLETDILILGNTINIAGLLRPILAEALVIETQTILALFPDLPAEIQTLLTSLLPETIDLNSLPLAGARLTALSGTGVRLGSTISKLDGSYQLDLRNATRLRVERLGYQTRIIELMDVMPAPTQLQFPDKIGMTPNPGQLTVAVNDGRRPIINAAVSVLTADGQPMTMTSRYGLASFRGIQPLLPGLVGGIGLHNGLIDAPEFFLQSFQSLFLASNAITVATLRQAPPFGALEGKVEVCRGVGKCGETLLATTSPYQNVTIDILDLSTREPIPAPPAESTQANGTYAFSDEAFTPDEAGFYTVPKGSYNVRFTNPSGGGAITVEGVDIASARVTSDVNACFSSLNGSFGVLFVGSNTSRSVVIRDAATDTIVANAASPGNTRNFVYEILGLPPGTYKIQFIRGGSTVAYTENNYVIGQCEAKTLIKGN